MQRRQTATEVCSWEWRSSLLGDLLSGCLISQINELKVCKRGSVFWKAAIWFLHLMQLYQASASRNWWAIWPRFWKQGIEVLSHLTALTGTLNSDDWLFMAKMSGLISLAKSLLMLMCLVPQLWWTSFCEKPHTAQTQRKYATSLEGVSIPDSLPKGAHQSHTTSESSRRTCGKILILFIGGTMNILISPDLKGTNLFPLHDVL